MNKLNEIANEIDRILKSGIEILPNSPIHEKLQQALNIQPLNNSHISINTFSDFESKVQSFCIPEEFKKCKDNLKTLRFSSYDSFISFLKFGGSIDNSIIACEEVFKLSCLYPLTEIELVALSIKFSLIYALIDVKHL
jgi:hypothetical protein